MPYIPKDKREMLDAVLKKAWIHNPGELNYAITRLVKEYLNEQTAIRMTRNYVLLNEIYGAMILAAEEFREKVIVPYEQKKEAENGSIY